MTVGTGRSDDPGLPRVTVLLATYQGRAYLPEMLASVFAQDGVQVHVVVSDDGSTDGTWEWLLERADAEPRLELLPRVAHSGGAAANFYRLLRETRTDGVVAFADQDDTWRDGKLATHLALLATGADGVSSNVVSTRPDGGTWLLRKDYPQRAWDWVFEGPGPGCTFLLSPRLVALVRERLDDADSPAAGTDYHDWLVYAVCRARGWRWLIDDVPSVDYRQHTTNVLGANKGLAAARRRLVLARQGWHRKQACAMARVGCEVAPTESRADLRALVSLLEDGGAGSRLRLAARATQARRRPRDRAVFGALVLSGNW